MDDSSVSKIFGARNLLMVLGDVFVVIFIFLFLSAVQSCDDGSLYTSTEKTANFIKDENDSIATNVTLARNLQTKPLDIDSNSEDSKKLDANIGSWFIRLFLVSLLVILAFVGLIASLSPNQKKQAPIIKSDIVE